MKPVQNQPWSNWSGLHKSVPRETYRPNSHEQVRALVQKARDTQRRVRALGSGHSFTDTALASDMLLDTSMLQGVAGFDLAKKQVTLYAGTKLWQIPALLHASGLAMQNLGDINRQSIAGAISTGTHGTGLQFGGLSSQLVGLRMIDGTGKELTVTAADHERLDALRVTLGCYGVLTEVTLQLVNDYDLEITESRLGLETTLNSWESLCESSDHFEFFWFTGHDTVITKTSKRVQPRQLPRSSQNSLQHLVNDELLGNGVFALLCKAGKLQPRMIPQLNSFAAKGWQPSSKVLNWSQGFTSPRRVKFNEMEYAVPFAAVPEILREIKRVVAKRKLYATFPLEVRSAAADTGWLASNHGRATGYIAVHQHVSQAYAEYFQVCEEIFKAHDGRPHWGKMHTLQAADFAELYPHWEQSLALRKELDPQGIFANAYSRRVFGNY